MKGLHDFPFSAEEQRQEAAGRADKTSIQGVQPKLSARFDIKKGMFQIVDTGGHFILKPQNLLFPEIPQVELSPAYDLVNTTIALKTPAKELALPLRGKKNNLQSQDFFEYLAASA